MDRGNVALSTLFEKKIPDKTNTRDVQSYAVSGHEHTNAHMCTHTEIIPFAFFYNNLSFTAFLPVNVIFYSYV